MRMQRRQEVSLSAHQLTPVMTTTQAFQKLAPENQRTRVLWGSMRSNWGTAAVGVVHWNPPEAWQDLRNLLGTENYVLNMHNNFYYISVFNATSSLTIYFAFLITSTLKRWSWWYPDWKCRIWKIWTCLHVPSAPRLSALTKMLTNPSFVAMWVHSVVVPLLPFAGLTKRITKLILELQIQSSQDVWWQCSYIHARW